MFGTYERLGVSIWESNISVIRATVTKINPLQRHGIEFRAARKALYRQMIFYHADARAIAVAYRL